MAQVEIQRKTLGERLQSLNKSTLYAILFAVTSIPLWFPGIKVPNKPEESTIDLYAALNALPAESTVLISSDWTRSTRGESGGQFEAIMRILMRKRIKVAIYTTADPQAPQVARDEMAMLTEEHQKAGDPPYERWKDYVVLGFFANAEGTNLSMAANLRAAWKGRKDVGPNGQLMDVFQSPVLQKVQSLKDVPLLLVITASKTSNITIQRLYGKVPLAMAVTGVMGPETAVFYASGQLIGLSKGLKGVYDLETMMQNGVNSPNMQSAVVKSEKYQGKEIPGFPGKHNLDRGSLYYPTLHFALALLIVAVIVGNLGMVLSRRRNA